jgi:hypothetical protein
MKNPPKETDPAKTFSLSEDSLNKCIELMKVLEHPSLLKLIESLILEVHRDIFTGKRTIAGVTDVISRRKSSRINKRAHYGQTIGKKINPKPRT